MTSAVTHTGVIEENLMKTIRARYEVQAETQSSYLNMALVGGGSGCKALIRFLGAYRLQNFDVYTVFLVALSGKA